MRDLVDSHTQQHTILPCVFYTMIRARTPRPPAPTQCRRLERRPEPRCQQLLQTKFERVPEWNVRPKKRRKKRRNE